MSRTLPRILVPPLLLAVVLFGPVACRNTPKDGAAPGSSTSSAPSPTSAPSTGSAPSPTSAPSP